MNERLQISYTKNFLRNPMSSDSSVSASKNIAACSSLSTFVLLSGVLSMRPTNHILHKRDRDISHHNGNPAAAFVNEVAEDLESPLFLEQKGVSDNSKWEIDQLTMFSWFLRPLWVLIYFECNKKDPTFISAVRGTCSFVPSFIQP